MSRLEITDNMLNIFTKMSEGNPGALQALMSLNNEAEEIDPQNALGGLGFILSLDTYRIYGSNIYILWNDKCLNETRKFVLLLRATQLGIFPHLKLKKLSEDEMRKVNITDGEWLRIDKEVCEQLTEFQKPE